MKSKSGKKSAESSKKAKASKSHKITVAVQVSYVGSGGNVGSGAYQYSCTPDVVHVTEVATLIRYELTPQTGAEFTFTALYSSDSLYKPQLSKPVLKRKGRAIEVVHANKIATLINIAFQIHDSEKQVSASCDPQVTNEPDPS